MPIFNNMFIWKHLVAQHTIRDFKHNTSWDNRLSWLLWCLITSSNVNFAFVYEEKWNVIMPSCMTGVIWSQSTEVTKALMIGSYLVYCLRLQYTSKPLQACPLVVPNMSIVVWYHDLLSTSSYDFKDEFGDLFIYCIKLRQWLSKAKYLWYCMIHPVARVDLSHNRYWETFHLLPVPSMEWCIYHRS